MLPKTILGLTTAVIVAAMPTIVSAATETGLATALHSVRREGGRLCMTDHWHYGSSNGKSSKAAAQRAAIASWQDFTDLEYGSVWARFTRAASKKMGCSRASAGWSCDVEARPCK